MKFLNALSTTILAASAINVQGSTPCLDTQFGSGGKVLTQFGSIKTNNVASAGMAVNINNGNIAIVGYASQGGPNQMAVAQYLASGEADTGFDGEGQVLTTVLDSRHESGATSAEYQSDNKLVVAGTVYTAANGMFDYDFACVRYNPSGSLDSSFGKGGKVYFDFAKGDDEVAAMEIQTDGKIILAGHASSNSGNIGFAAARLTSSGNLDATFGTNGKVTTSFGPTADRASGLALLSDGSMVLVGSAIVNKKNVIALLKYTSAGALDSSFGVGGKTTTTVLGDDSASEVVVQNDGKLVVIGSAAATTGLAGSSLVVARYLPNGSLDSSFGKAGVVVSNFGYQDAFGADLILAGSNIALAGYVVKGSNEYSFVASLTSKGAVDESFTPYFASEDDDQVKSTSIALDNAGRVLVSSTAATSEELTGFGLARFSCLSSKATAPPSKGIIKKTKKPKKGLRD